MRVSLLRCCAYLLALALPLLAPAQAAPEPPRISRIVIQHLGPPGASDDYIRGSLRTKPGDPYQPAAVTADVRNLYATGLFYNIRVTESNAVGGLVLTFVVQGHPRLTEVKFTGNHQFSESKLRKLLSSKVGEPMSERKLFTDSQAIKEKYQKAGYPGTEVRYALSIEESAGRGSATFEITETPKVKIAEIAFDGATAFSQGTLRGVIKTKRRNWFSWLTGSGVLKDEEFQNDKEVLAEYYRSHGYIDFEIKDVLFLNPTPDTLVIRFVLYEGQQYKVGTVKFEGNKIFTTNQISAGMRAAHEARQMKAKLGSHGLVMDTGDTFTPEGYQQDQQMVADFYGSRGFTDVTAGSRNLILARVPNTETGTMDLEFHIDEGQKSYIEKIQITGNTKTKDNVIRRELAVSPGEVFDMVRVRVSKLRLEGLQYFERVETRAEPTDISPARKNLVVAVEEKNTGNLSVGAGFSSVDSLVGTIEFYQGNFDLFHPPNFTGAGQKLRLRAQIGTQRKDMVITFIEPWMFGRKLTMSVDLFYREMSYLSLDDLYDETMAGGSLSFTRALWSDFVRGTLKYTLENIGIDLNPGVAGDAPFSLNQPTAPPDIVEQQGHHTLSTISATIAYDTRGGGRLPNKGQRTEFTAAYTGLGGDVNFYQFDARTAWYFKGFAKGHILELVGRAGVEQSLQEEDVPFYERYYLGGLNTLRGFRYRSVSPRQPGFSEPVGGDTYWFGSAEYSIPIYETDKERGMGVRVAMFYDIGNVLSNPYDFSFTQYSDNWGFGLHLNLPIGPIRLDYGIPIQHPNNPGHGRFQIGASYTRDF